MALSLISHKVTDLCLGKPALRSLPITATIGDALFALRNSEDNFLSVWNCDHSNNNHKASNRLCREEDKEAVVKPSCVCVGKICMVDVICFLCKEENLLSPSDALNTPVSEILNKIPGLVKHVEPSYSLLDAIDLILQGAQNLVVPIQTKYPKRKQSYQNKPSNDPTSTLHNGREFCWLTQEDVIRFLLNSIAIFSPIPTYSIDSLGLVKSEKILSIHYHSPASSALNSISQSLTEQTSVAVIDSEGILIGEISPFTLACCDETVAAAVATLSAGDLMAYIDCGGPPEDLVRVVRNKLKERNLEKMLEEFMLDDSNSSGGSLCSQLSTSSLNSSSDEESMMSPKTTLARSSGKYYTRSSSNLGRFVRRSEAIVCHPKSSLVAVMIQAIAYRVNYVWVVEDDCSLVGMVTFSSMLEVFREHLENMF